MSSCTETTFIINSAKKISGINKKPNYKVGNPYKINGQWFYPAVDYNYDEIGIASWYGPNFHGKKTANGEIFDQNKISAAHKTLPLPSIVNVTNLENGKSLIIRINDRGPFVRGRIIDLSKKAAEILGVLKIGTAKVNVKIIENESRKLAIGSNVETFVSKKGFTESVKKKELNEPKNASINKQNSDLKTNSKVITEKDEANIFTNLEENITIQIGAFTDIRNAKKLLEKLRDFKAYINRDYVNKKYFYRVRIGPFTKKKFADTIIKDLYDKGFNSAKIVIKSLK